jgi:hypothetical protein
MVRAIWHDFPFRPVADGKDRMRAIDYLSENLSSHQGRSGVVGDF